MKVPLQFLRRCLLLVMVFVPFGVAIAGPLLRSTSGSRFYGPTSVWTGASTTVPVFHPLSPPIAAAGLLSARFAAQMTQDSGDCKMRVAVRFSNDGVGWDASKDVGAAYVTDDVVQYGTTYVDLQPLAGATSRSWIQYGVDVMNRSTATVAACNAQMRIEEQTQ